MITAPPWRHVLAVGDGAVEVKDDSGAVTASQSGATVTASGSFFAAGDIGDLIVWDSGETARVTGYTDATHVTVAASQTVASAEFAIWRVQRYALGNELLSSFADGGFASEEAYTETSGDSMQVELTVTRLVTMDVNRNVNEWSLRPYLLTSGDDVIIDLVRDGTGAPQTLSILAGKKFGVQHTLTVTLPWLVQSSDFDLEEYDLSGSLVNTAYTADHILTYVYNFAGTDLQRRRVFNFWDPCDANNAPSKNNLSAGVPHARKPWLTRRPTRSTRQASRTAWMMPRGRITPMATVTATWPPRCRRELATSNMKGFALYYDGGSSSFVSGCWSSSPAPRRSRRRTRISSHLPHARIMGSGVPVMAVPPAVTLRDRQTPPRGATNVPLAITPPASSTSITSRASSFASAARLVVKDLRAAPWWCRTRWPIADTVATRTGSDAFGSG